jgi:hypothetical protein
LKNRLSLEKDLCNQEPKFAKKIKKILIQMDLKYTNETKLRVLTNVLNFNWPLHWWYQPTAFLITDETLLCTYTWLWAPEHWIAYLLRCLTRRMRKFRLAFASHFATPDSFHSWWLQKFFLAEPSHPEIFKKIFFFYLYQPRSFWSWKFQKMYFVYFNYIIA